GFPARRIDGEDGNAEPVFLVEPEAAHQLVGERGFSRTPGARDPEGRYGKRLGLLQYLLAELGMRGAALERGDETRQRPALAGLDRRDLLLPLLRPVLVAALEHVVDH